MRVPQCENLQKVGAFKYRGALNAVKKHLESAAGVDRPTFVTHSSGNHGQALALAARDAGCRAVIIMVFAVRFSAYVIYGHLTD